MHRRSPIDFNDTKVGRSQQISLTTERYGQSPTMLGFDEPAPLRSHRVEADRGMHGYIPARRGEAGFRVQSGSPGESPWTNQYNRQLDASLRHQLNQQMHNKMRYQKPDNNTLSDLFPRVVGGKKQGGRSISYSTDFGHQFGDTRQLTAPCLPHLEYAPAKLGGSAMTVRPTADSHMTSKEFEMDQIQHPHATHAEIQQFHLASGSTRMDSHQIANKFSLPSHSMITLPTNDPIVATLPLRTPLTYKHHIPKGQLYRIPTESLELHINRPVGQPVFQPVHVNSQSLLPISMVMPVMTNIKHVSAPIALAPRSKNAQIAHTSSAYVDMTHTVSQTPSVAFQTPSKNIQISSSSLQPIASSHQPGHSVSLGPMVHNAVHQNPMTFLSESSHQQRQSLPSTTNRVHQTSHPNSQMDSYSESTHPFSDAQSVSAHLEQIPVAGYLPLDTDMAKIPLEEKYTDGLLRGPQFRQESTTSAQINHERFIDSSRRDSHQAGAHLNYSAPLTHLTQAATRHVQSQDKSIDVQLCKTRTGVR